MEEVGPDNEIGLDDVNSGDVVDVLDGGYTINDRRSLGKGSTKKNVFFRALPE